MAIVQSNYIPWKGYFDLMSRVDEFILFDDRQYTRRDWRNRNQIKTAQGPRWLTIPVESSGRYLQRIDQTRVSDAAWAVDHWRTIEAAYRGAAHWATESDWLEELYRAPRSPRLSEINRAFLEAFCSRLEIRTKLSWSTDYNVTGSRTERLVNLCLAAGATHYISGPAARAYIEPDLFATAGVDLEYIVYEGYPEYEQPHPPFRHQVSIVDLALCTGPMARHHVRPPRRTGPEVD